MLSQIKADWKFIPGGTQIQTSYLEVKLDAQKYIFVTTPVSDSDWNSMRAIPKSDPNHSEPIGKTF